MKELIGYCGIDCKKCDAYIATINDDRALREETAKKWSKLNNTTILSKQINCEGCRINWKKTIFCERLCGIRQCAIKKDVTTCGDCSKLENCPIVWMIHKNNPEALNNLKNKQKEL